MTLTMIRFGDIRPILDSVARSGVSVEQLPSLRSFLDASDGIEDSAKLTITDYFRIQRDIALAFDDLTAQLSDRKLTYKTGHFVVSQLQNAPNLHGAIVSLVEHFNMMHGDAYNSVRLTEDRVSFVVDDSSFPYRFRDNERLVQFIGDCLMIKVHCLLDSLSNGIASKALRRIRLQRKRTAPAELQNAFWSVPIDYDHPTYEAIYDFDIACRPFDVPDRLDLTTDGLFARVIAYLEQSDPSRQSQSMTTRTLDVIEHDWVTQSDVAEQLGISVATHRRRLREEGVSFRDLIVKTRLVRAESMLRKGYTISQITGELEYSDIRAFNRAFKRWKGLTPAEYAKHAQAGK